MKLIFREITIDTIEVYFIIVLEICLILNKKRKDVDEFRMKILNRIILIVIILFTLSCGIFEPRNSDSPEKPVPWLSYPINKDQVLTNLESSYLYSENINNYEKIFTDDFIFYFASQDITEHGTPSQLNINQESEMIMVLHKSLNDYNQQIFLDTLATIDGEDDLINNTNATLYRSYYIRIEDLRNKQKDTKVYQGKAEFNLIQNTETSLWEMQSWKDYRTTSNQTWGLLKNEFTY